MNLLGHGRKTTSGLLSRKMRCVVWKVPELLVGVPACSIGRELLLCDPQGKVLEVTRSYLPQD